MAEGWPASHPPQYPGVCIARHTGALKSVSLCLLLCLMSLPAYNLHWSRGELSVKLLLLRVKACKLNVSPHCCTSLDLLMLSAKCCPRGKHFHQTEHTSTLTQTHLSCVLQTRQGIKRLFFCCLLSFGAQDSRSHDSWLDFFSSFLPAQISYFISSIHTQRPFAVPQ